MKFTASEALAEVKKRLEKTALKQIISDRTIQENLETLTALVATDEMELPDFIEKVFSTFNTMNKGQNKDVADKIKEYEKKNPRSPEDTDDDDDKGKGKTTPPSTSPEMEEMRKAMKEMQETMKTITTTVVAVQKDKNAVSLRTTLYAETVEKYGEEFAKEHFDKVVKRIDFSSEDARKLVEEDIEERAVDTKTATRDPNAKPKDEDAFDYEAENEELVRQGLKKPKPTPPAS